MTCPDPDIPTLLREIAAALEGEREWVAELVSEATIALATLDDLAGIWNNPRWGLENRERLRVVLKKARGEA